MLLVSSSRLDVLNWPVLVNWKSQIKPAESKILQENLNLKILFKKTNEKKIFRK